MAANICWFLTAVGHNGSRHRGSRHTLDDSLRLEAKLAKNGLEAMGQEELEDGKVTEEDCLFMSKPLRRTGKGWTGKEAERLPTDDPDAGLDELFLLLQLNIESVTRISVEEDLDLDLSALLLDSLDTEAELERAGLLLFLLPFSLLKEGNGSDPI